MASTLSNNTFGVNEEGKNCLFFPWQLSLISPSFGLFIAILNCLSSIFTIMIANGLVIATVYRTSNLHSPSNLLIAGLAMSDFGTGLITQPSHFIEFMAAFHGDSCTANTAFLVFNISGWVFTMLSLYTLSCIVIERYLAITLHLRYNEKVTVKRTMLVLLLAWVLIPLASALINVERVKTPQEFLFTNAIFIIIGSIITTLCYVKVFLAARGHFGQIRCQLQDHPMTQVAITTTRYRRKFFTFVFIVVTFMACYFPYSVAILTGFKQRSRTILLTLVAGSNSCLNPLIYFWRINELREAAKRHVKKLIPCNNP